MQNFYESYPDMLVRQVKSKPGPSWLGGKTKGYALEVVAPRASSARAAGKRANAPDGRRRIPVRALGKAQPLGTMPLVGRHAAIRVALSGFARGDAFEQWTTKVQTAALATAICRGDELPGAGAGRARDVRARVRLSARPSLD